MQQTADFILFQSYYFGVFLFGKDSHAASLRCQQEDHVGKTAIILSSNKKPQLLNGCCTLYPWLVAKAAKVERNDTNNGVIHWTSKTLFESQSWEKCEQAEKSGEILASWNLSVRQS